MIRRVLTVLALTAALGASAASAADLRVMCYQDGNECAVYQDLAGRFMKDHSDIHVTVDTVPYSAILQSLPVQLAAGNGPDIARITDFGATGKYLLDLRPLLPDADRWETAFGPVLDWMRGTAADKGIYGLLTQLTVTGPFINKTLVRSGRRRRAAGDRHLGRLGEGCGQGREGDADAIWHGVGPLRPSFRRSGDFVWCEIFCCGRNA